MGLTLCDTCLIWEKDEWLQALLGRTTDMKEEEESRRWIFSSPIDTLCRRFLWTEPILLPEVILSLASHRCVARGFGQIGLVRLTHSHKDLTGH